MIVSLRKLRGRLAAARVSSNTGHTAHPPDISSAGALDAARRTLHIRCGHDIMEKLALAGFSGDFLCFADPFAQGPIVRAGSLEAFVRTRAAFIESQKLASNAFDALYESYRDLDRAREYASVNVWLEHDSYDQLVLAKLLDYFSDAKTRPAELRLITVTSFPGVQRFIGLGQLSPDALRGLWSEFRPVTDSQLALGREVWTALAAPTPEALARIVSTETPVLPTMAPALARHLRELPSAENGLSLTEQLTLKILAEKGPMRAPRLFGHYTNEYEPLPFLGDSGYWIVLRGLADAKEPAISIEELRDSPPEHNRHWHVTLLPFGECLLRNQADWLRSNAVQRWVGGVSIDSAQPANWRSDAHAGVVLTR